MDKKFNYFVDLIDYKITTAKIHPFYKGFRTLKQAQKYINMDKFEKSLKGLKQKRIKQLNKLIEEGATFEQLRFKSYPEKFIKEHSKIVDNFKK